MTRDYMSFGGGVQSTAIAMLAINRDERLLAVTGGKVPELYLFADTGDEPMSVYENVWDMAGRISGEAEFTVCRQPGPKLSEHILKPRAGKRHAKLPAFVRDKDGGSVPLRRQCTSSFKVDPLRRAARKAAGIFNRQVKSLVVRFWMGISLDEQQRMKIAMEPWQEYFYPLILMGWRRQDCIRYLERLGMSIARSACFYCPFHSNREWQRMKTEEPSEFARAIDFERRMHESYRENDWNLLSKPYLHPSRTPIDEIDFTGGQLDLFGMDNECAGVCGV